MHISKKINWYKCPVCGQEGGADTFARRKENLNLKWYSLYYEYNDTVCPSCNTELKVKNMALVLLIVLVVIIGGTLVDPYFLDMPIATVVFAVIAFRVLFKKFVRLEVKNA